MGLSMKISEDFLKTAVTVILRLPALFILEFWWRNHPEWFISRYDLYDVEMVVNVAYDITPIVTVIVGTLPLPLLVRFYINLICAGLMSVAGYATRSNFSTDVEGDAKEKNVDDSLSGETWNIFEGGFMSDTLRNLSPTERLFLSVLAQVLISAVVGYLMETKSRVRFALLAVAPASIVRLVDILAEQSDLSLELIHKCFMVYTFVLIFFCVVYNRVSILQVFKGGIRMRVTMLRKYGITPVVMHLWKTLALGVQLLLFGMIMVVLQMYIYAYGEILSVWHKGWPAALLASIVDCCATPLGVLGISISIGFTTGAILNLTELYLFGAVVSNTSGRGLSEGLTILFMVAQTDELDMKFLEGLFLMKFLLYYVGVSLIRSMFEIADPFLFALGASYNRSLLKHLKAVSLCIFLGVFPLYMTYLLSRNVDLNFWLIIVVSYSLVNSLQAIRSLIVYILLMYDSLRSEPWENLDDIIFFAKTLVKSFELLVAVYVSYFGLSESFVGEWSWIIYISYVLHTYFNVYKRLQNGMKTLVVRREAARKVVSLPRVSDDLLLEHENVCAICWGVMRTACITTCLHVFHSTCLRKWFYVNNTCPICRNEQVASYSWRTHLTQKDPDLITHWALTDYIVNGAEEGIKETKRIDKSLRAIYKN